MMPNLRESGLIFFSYFRRARTDVHIGKDGDSDGEREETGMIPKELGFTFSLLLRSHHAHGLAWVCFQELNWTVSMHNSRFTNLKLLLGK